MIMKKTKTCLQTPDTQKKPQLLIPSNGDKNTLQEIENEYFQKGSPIVTETSNHCKIEPLEKSASVTSTPAVVKRSILATEETIASFKKMPVEY